MDWIWLDNKIVHKKDARISGFDEGFLYGQGLFETMRCYRGKVFALDRHLKRLIQSCPVLGMEAPQKRKLEKAVYSVIRKNHLKDAYLRLNVFKHFHGTCIFVFAGKLSLPTECHYKKGFSVMLSKEEGIGISVLNGVKSLNHYFYVRLSNLAKQKGFNEAFFLNSHGEVVEGSRTNIFLVKNKKVLTPHLSCGCLPGITRGLVIETLKRLSIPLAECKIYPKELLRQDEIFVTNSLIGVMPVTRIDKRRVADGKVGAVTKLVMKAYEKIVEHERFLR